MRKNISIFYLTRQNLKRKLFRSLVTIAAVAIVAIVLFPTTILSKSVSDSLDKGVARLGADLMVVAPGNVSKISSTLIAGNPSTFLMDGSVIDEVANVEGVEQVSPQLYFATLGSG
jgi:putative ABC transport system permease protein